MSQADILLGAQIHCASSLPKMDRLSASDPFVCMVCAGQQVQTTVRSNTHAPEWDEFLVMQVRCPYEKPSGKVRFEVWDKDVFSNEEIALVQFELAEIDDTLVEHACILTLFEGVRPRSEGPPMLVLSMGYVLDYPSLKERLERTPGVHCDDLGRTVYVPTPALGRGIYLAVVYGEFNGSITVRLLKTDPSERGRYDLRAPHHPEYTQGRIDAQVGWQEGPLTVYGEVRLEHLPIYADFGDLKIERGLPSLEWQGSVDELLHPLHWTPDMSFKKASRTLSGMLFDTVNQRAFVPHLHCALSLAWTADEIDLGIYVLASGSPSQRVFDLGHSGYRMVRTETTFGTARPLADAKGIAGQPAAREALANSYTTRHLSLHDLPLRVDLSQVHMEIAWSTSTRSWSLLDLVPLRG